MDIKSLLELACAKIASLIKGMTIPEIREYFKNNPLLKVKNYKMKTEIKVASEYSKYPSIFKDLSFLIDKKVNFTQLKKEIEKSTKNLKKLNFFNVYFDESFLKEIINIVIRLEFKSENETLTNEFIEEEIINIKEKLKELYKVEFRE